jgi:hypothetical protein
MNQSCALLPGFHPVKTMGVLCCILMCFLAALSMEAQTYPGPYPQKEISNGLLRAKLYLPDPDHGFYRGTRFDWSGVMASLEYKGHQYFGPFFEKFNPSVPDVVIGNPIEAGINSAASGPVEEFTSGPDGTALGYQEAKPGEAFCKIGVGSLRKIDNTPYSSYINYPILNGGTRSEKSGPDWVEFTQDLTCGSGYGYTYKKTIRLEKNEPVMTIEHRLSNTGKKAIETQVYDHNFLTIDRQTTGSAISIGFAFPPQPTAALDKLVEIREKQLLFPKDLKGSDTFYDEFKGFRSSAQDYQIRVENHQTGAGVEIHGDKPLVYVGVWAVRTVVAPEPYIEIKVPAGQEFSWKYTYRFYETAGRR